MGDVMKRFFRQGDEGHKVETIQERLKDLGFYEFKVDGIFGPITDEAVKEFQRSAKLNADGVVGPITWKALGLQKSEDPSGIVAVPNGIDQIYAIFGDPLEPGYWSEYGGFCETPPELNHVFTYEWEGRNGFWCNKLMIAPFQKALSSVVKAGLADKLHTFDGCYNVRYIRGRKNLSTHSWGISIDLDASRNPLGAEPKMHPGVVSCFENNGFVWGGRWRRKDGMHFQYAKGY